MNDAMLDDIEIEKMCRERFSVNLDIDVTLARNIPVGVAAKATLFMTTNRQVYAYIMAQSGMVLDDVRKIIHRMQAEAETFLPPHGDKEYFDRIGREKFKVMFPGKPVANEDDLRYYKNLAPYNPALVLISKIKGEIRAFEIESKSWRKIKDYAYSRIKPR